MAVSGFAAVGRAIVVVDAVVVVDADDADDVLPASNTSSGSRPRARADCNNDLTVLPAALSAAVVVDVDVVAVVGTDAATANRRAASPS